MTPTVDDVTITSMIDYYRERATYYERVYHKPERQAELRTMEAALADAFEGRRVLDIACGTGWWLPHGARRANHWLATDFNEATLAVARQKPLPDGVVGFACMDAYNLPGTLKAQRFDAAFAGCWWSHVPLPRLKPWLAHLHAHLQIGARVVFLDNARHLHTQSTPLHRRDADGNTYQWRTLDDGTRHEVVKNYPTRDEALAAIGPQVHDVHWIERDHYWVLSYVLGPEPTSST